MKRAALIGSVFWVTLLFLNAQNAGSFSYLDPQSVAVGKLLDLPPAVGSPQAIGELAEVHAWERTRTADDIERIKRERDLKGLPFVFDDVFGKDFTPEKLPRTFKVLTGVTADCILISEKAKQAESWQRLRPFNQDKSVHPVFEARELPKTSSYPSGHAMTGTCLGRILVQLAPADEEQIEQRARLIREDRVIGGVHFRSDIEAGRRLGDYLADRFLASPSFKADLAKAREEMELSLQTAGAIHH